jgi:uncharacterized protein YycO
MGAERRKGWSDYFPMAALLRSRDNASVSTMYMMFESSATSSYGEPRYLGMGTSHGHILIFSRNGDLLEDYDTGVESSAVNFKTGGIQRSAKFHI